MLPIEILFFIMFRSFYIQDVKGIIRAWYPADKSVKITLKNTHIKCI